jgi:magnesium chelatase family protein
VLCRPDPAAQALLTQALDRLGLSARSYHRLRKLARTVADLNGIETINSECISEAIHYRRSPLQQYTRS